jgi:hypothetical protein
MFPPQISAHRFHTTAYYPAPQSCDIFSDFHESD